MIRPLLVLLLLALAAPESFADAGPREVVLQELWRLGGDAADARQMFGVISDICIDDEGRLYVVDEQLSRVAVFSPDGRFIREIGREGDGPGEFRRPRRVFLSPDDEVCVVSSSRGVVHVFAPDGTRSATLTRDYERRRRSSEQKRAIYDWATVNPNGLLPGTTIHIQDHDQDVQAIHARDKGTVWILTSRGVHDRPEGSLGVFDVFDRDGEFTGRVSLVGDGDPTSDRYHFAGDRLYVVTCFKGALAAMLAGGRENRFSKECTEPMAIIGYRLPPSGR